jgi:hypothetical protein
MMIMNERPSWFEKCPSPLCGADLNGPEVPRQLRREGYYGPYEESDPPRFYSRVVAFTIRGFYDGVAYWQCPECNVVWHRADDMFDDHRKMWVESQWAEKGLTSLDDVLASVPQPQT